MKRNLIIICAVVVFLGAILYFVNNYIKDLLTEKPEPTVDLQFKDIAYLDEINFSKIMFIDDFGRHQTSSHIIIPEFRKINIFKRELYKIEGYLHNTSIDIYWGIDGEVLGTLFRTHYPSVGYPALLAENNEIYTCLEDDNLHTNYDYPIQVIDSERIVINIGDYPENYLLLYNMKNCEEESIFYSGYMVGRFSISSKKWLAVNEYINGDQQLNIYDETKTLVYSENDIDDYNYFTWSKDGNILIYRVYKSLSDDKFYAHDFQKNETYLIGENIYRASFSPDGKYLVIQRPQYKLFLLDLDTMEETFLVNGVNPDWRP
ncbi:MAG: PD40 domain-containing protein [Anaerolineaceae bacterium]|nr:PD40 domain-containing protein [Anaerolineaceae bacterium]